MSPFPGGPPGGYPPSGPLDFGQSGEPPKRNTGLIIAGGLAAAAVIVAGVLVLTGRGDDKTVASQVTPVRTVLVSIPDITMSPEGTSVITAPVITEPDVTVPAITEPPSTDTPITQPATQTSVASGAELTDDLGVFAVVLPDGLDVDTAPINTQNNLTLAAIAGAQDLSGFFNDDVTPGMTVIVVGADVASTPALVLAFLQPEEGVCAVSDQVDDHATTLGVGILLRLDGCSGGTAAKVIIVVEIGGTSSIAAMYLQGPGPSADLLPLAQSVFETVRLL